MIRHELRAGSTIEAHGEQIRMRNRSVKRVSGLSGQHRAHLLDGARDHHRDAEAQFFAETVDGEQTCLDVARVLAGFEQQNVGAAVNQSLRLLVEAIDKLRKRDAATDRDGFCSRAH